MTRPAEPQATSASDSNNLDDRFISRIPRRKSKRSDSSDYDSVELMTPFFDFHSVVSVLMTPPLGETNVKTFHYNLQD